ncbi:MAG: electron transport complex subunit RsxG [Thioploca sp.]|nr:electron transport complex subunit RsxG [Thioploca sp.]
MKLAKLRGKLSYQTILLGSVTLLTSGVLAVANYLTQEAIQAAEMQDIKHTLVQVLPIQYDNDLLQDTVILPGIDGNLLTVYRARQRKQVVAVVFQVSQFGYAGPVVLMMGISRTGEVLGVRVLKHSETPGLGDKIELAKNNWILSFNGRSLTNPVTTQWQVKKDGGVFDQFTGATITPRAVVRAVKQGLEFFTAHQAEFL